jgi:hypothetical protein
MTTTKQISIKAMWPIESDKPVFCFAGKNIECVGDHSSWTLAGYDLQKWMNRNHPGAQPIFYGPCATSAFYSWEEANK